MSGVEISTSVRDRDSPSQKMTGGYVEPAAAGKVAEPAFDCHQNPSAAAGNDGCSTLNAGKSVGHTKKSPAE